MDESERRILEARLENWSRWAREGRPQGTSSILGIMREAGYKQTEGVKETPIRVDVKDALIIEDAWSRMLESREKRLLQEVYVHPSKPLWIMCRRAGVRQGRYEYHILLAMKMLHNILCRDKLRSSDLCRY